MPVINEIEVRGIIVGVFQENCYIVASPKTREAIAIDAGDDPERILDLAKDMGVHVKFNFLTLHAMHSFLTTHHRIPTLDTLVILLLMVSSLGLHLLASY